MRNKLAIALLLLLASVSIAHAQDEVSDIFSRINNLRSSVGRAPYILNGSLSAAAANQAQWIVETGNVSHTRPDGSGPRTRALNAGYVSVQVSENIYGGTYATVNDAWTFWVNSGIHYAGLINAAYNEVGVGAAHGSWGAAYVLVFGNSGGPAPAPPQVFSASESGSNAPAAPPIYVVGQDEHGNIMHEVQPGDTLGDIALIYGYTWDDLPAMLALNGLTDVRDLEVGSIFLVPPKSGTFTPTPVEATPMPEETAAPLPPTITPTVPFVPVREATLIVTPLEMMTASATPNAITAVENLAPTIGGTQAAPDGIATVGAAAPTIESTLSASATLLPPGTEVAMVISNPQSNPPATEPPAPRNNNSLWIGIAVVVQLLIVAVAAAEFGRRARRGKRR